MRWRLGWPDNRMWLALTQERLLIRYLPPSGRRKLRTSQDKRSTRYPKLRNEHLFPTVQYIVTMISLLFVARELFDQYLWENCIFLKLCCGIKSNYLKDQIWVGSVNLYDRTLIHRIFSNGG